MRILIVLILSGVCAFGQGASSIGVRNPEVLQVMNPILYPTQVVGLIEWLAADVGVYSDAGSTPAVDGDAVRQWNSISVGVNLTQSTAARRPKYNTSLFGFPVLDFGQYDLSNEHSLSGTLGSAYNHPFTLFVVVWHSNVVASDNIFNYAAAGQNYMLESAGEFRIGSGAVFGNLLIFDKEVWNQFTAIYTNSDSRVLWNAKFNSRVTVAPVSQTGIVIGTGGIGKNWMGYIAEIILFSREVSKIERYGIEMYLKRKYSFSNAF